MKFGSWTFTGDQVSLILYNNKDYVDLSDYWKSGTWDIIEVSLRFWGGMFMRCPYWEGGVEILANFAEQYW